MNINFHVYTCSYKSVALPSAEINPMLPGERLLSYVLYKLQCHVSRSQVCVISTPPSMLLGDGQLTCSCCLLACVSPQTCYYYFLFSLCIYQATATLSSKKNPASVLSIPSVEQCYTAAYWVCFIPVASR